MLIGADSLHQVAEALDQYTAGQHIGEGGDVLAIAVGLIEGLGEAVADQKSKVGILTAEAGVCIGVAVNGIDALHIFGHHMAVGVHTEGAHLIAVLLGAVDQLGLVHHVGDMLKDGGGQFHPNPDVHLVVQQFQAQIFTLVGEPFCAGASGGGDEPAAGDLVSLLQGQAEAIPIPGDVLYGGIEAELQLVLQPLVDVLKDAQVVFGAQVLAPGLKQMQVIAQGPAGQGAGLCGLGGKDLLCSAVSYIDGVHIVDELHDLAGLHKVGEPSAKLGCEVELSVGKCACPSEAAHGVAYGAVDALPYLARYDGAAAMVDITPLVQGQDLQFRTVAGQFIGGKDPGLAAAQDDNVIDWIHGSLSLHFSK